MSDFFKKTYRSIKPPPGSQIDWGNPISQSLIGCWIMNEGVGNRVNSSTNRFNGINNGAVWTPSSQGNSLYFNGTSSYIDVPTLNRNIQRFSVHCVIYNSIGYATNSSFNIVAKDISTSRGWVCRGRSSGDTSKGLIMQAEWNGSLSAQSANFLPFNSWVHLTYVFDGTNFTGYVNGKIDISPTAAVPQANSAPIQIGRRNFAGFFEYFKDKIAHVFIWNRALTFQEAKSLYIAPYQMIKSRDSIFYSIPTPEAPVTPSESAYGYLSLNTAYW